MKSLIGYFELVFNVLIYFILFLSLITALLMFRGDLIVLCKSDPTVPLLLIVSTCGFLHVLLFYFFFKKLNLNVLHNCICRTSGKSSIKRIPSESVSVGFLRLVGSPLPRGEC